MGTPKNTTQRSYPVCLGEIDPRLERWSNCDFLHHEGKAVIYRKGMRFQASYESEKLHIFGDVKSDMLPAVGKLEYLIGKIRKRGDDEVQSMLPARK